MALYEAFVKSVPLFSWVARCLCRVWSPLLWSSCQ